MPSLDIKSEIDSHELLNAVDQANSVINNRYDFKGTDSKFTLDDEEITLISCLLYTSQSQRDKTQSRIPSSA